MNPGSLLPARRLKGRYLVPALAVLIAFAAVAYRLLPEAVLPGPQSPESSRAGLDRHIDTPRLALLLPEREEFRANAAMFRMGAELAVRRLAAENVKVTLDPTDSEEQPLTAGERLSVATSNPDTALVIAPLPLSALSEIVTEAQKAHLLLVVPGNSHQKLVDRSAVLPLAASDRTEGTLAASVLSGWASGGEAVVIHDPGPYGEVLLAGFAEGAAKAGLKYRRERLGREDLEAGKPMRPGITGDDTFAWLAGPPDWAAAVAEMLARNGARGRFLFPSSCTEPFLDRFLLAVPQNFFFLKPAVSAVAAGDTKREFRDAFVRSYRREPNRDARIGYDCVRWIGTALRDRPITRRSVRQRLIRATGPDNPYHGLSGTFYFDERGTTWNTLEPSNYVNGKFIFPGERETARDGP